MNITPLTDNIAEYLKVDDVVDYGNETITHLVDSLSQNIDSDIEYIKAAYEFV